MPIFSFIFFVVITSFTPGPNNIMAMSFANQYGLKRTVPFSVGVGIGFFIITLASSVFNIALTELMPTIQTPLSLLGVVYMLYLAFKIYRSTYEKSQQQKSTKNFLVIGTLLQFINPKGILYSIAVVATYVLPYYSSYISYFILSIILGFVGTLSTFTWALFGSILQKYLIAYTKPFNIVMALLLLYSAISLLIH
ncbi:LysE family translocator [Kurthia sibirica]|uniref:Lysine transporter LysE n=1 Tax=Kurthia sibirica TaxID=202750 RepID=A0A2U3AJ72_9BACL|nr:LysE family transporter [Kurthia sibirica]PWI24544.1 lysine transporter LysE [Kurthia sibirica]GEK33613.1 amino acid transporter LysE [Kurthia sibirica]